MESLGKLLALAIGIFGVVFLFAAITAVVSCFIGFFFMLAWNWVAPLFWAAAPHLSFLQSAGAVFLLSMLSKIFSRSGVKVSKA